MYLHVLHIIFLSAFHYRRLCCIANTAENIFLTCFSVNKNSGEFVQNSDVDQCVGHKWGLRALWRRLQDDGIDTDVIWDKISAIVIKVCFSLSACVFVCG